MIKDNQHKINILRVILDLNPAARGHALVLPKRHYKDVTTMPKTLLGLGEDASFTFKWADNYEDGDILSFYTQGDSAPYGRLNWVY